MIDNISNIFGSKNINKYDPLIIININKDYLISLNSRENIYAVNSNRIYKENPFLRNFTPTSHIKLCKKDSYNIFKILLANNNIIQKSSKFTYCGNNMWYGSNDKNYKSIGLYYSKTYPIYNIPVFPVSYMIKVNYDSEYNTLTNNKYYNYNINKHMFQIENSNKWKKNGIKVSLIKNDKPWYLNKKVVGNIALLKNPHQITGIQEVYNDKDRSNKNISNYKNTNENYENNCNKLSNLFITILCVILFILLFYRRSIK